MSDIIDLTDRASYRITIGGTLTATRSKFFGIQRLEHHHGTTTLTVTVDDQAALQGLLRHLYNLGSPLLQLHLISKEEHNHQSEHLKTQGHNDS